MRSDALITTGTLDAKSLRGQIAVVTSASQGIGFEVARVLIWLSAHVVIAEQRSITGFGQLRITASPKLDLWQQGEPDLAWPTSRLE